MHITSALPFKIYSPDFREEVESWGQEGGVQRALLPGEWFCVLMCMYVCVPLLQVHSLQSQLEFQEQSMVEKSLVSRQEAKIRELETKLEYERTQIKRLEVKWCCWSRKM